MKSEASPVPKPRNLGFLPNQAREKLGRKTSTVRRKLPVEPGNKPDVRRDGWVFAERLGSPQTGRSRMRGAGAGGGGGQLQERSAPGG